MSERFVVVTTDMHRRGVFGGVLVEHDQERKTAVLADAHMAVYWSQETRGVLGLAATGPQAGSRITPPVQRIMLDGVTAVMEATPEAASAWRAQPWG